MKLLCVVGVALATGCASLPANSSRTATTALPHTDETHLGQMLAHTVAQHPGESGVCPLSSSPDALAARIALADMAERSLDIQYYIWHGDETGKMRRRGVRVILATNSLASTDTVPVYAGYSRYRKELLRMGVELYELKPSANATHTASLYVKSFAFDRRVLFIGSFNLDPRSANLNTEMGVVFESPELTKPMVDRLEAKLGEIA